MFHLSVAVLCKFWWTPSFLGSAEHPLPRSRIYTYSPLRSMLLCCSGPLRLWSGWNPNRFLDFRCRVPCLGWIPRAPRFASPPSPSVLPLDSHPTLAVDPLAPLSWAPRLDPRRLCTAWHATSPLYGARHLHHSSGKWSNGNTGYQIKKYSSQENDSLKCEDAPELVSLLVIILLSKVWGIRSQFLLECLNLWCKDPNN